MQDITFDDFGMGVGSNVNNLRVLDSYREVLIRKFEVVASTLDQYQNNIVFNTDKEMPLKITAGAGSGKTQCLFAKALKMVLLDRIDPCSMVLITFTNKAADEIRDRYLNFFRDIIPPNFMVEIPIPHISTIHSFGLSVLYKLFGIRRTIMTESQAVRLLKYTILEVLGVKKVEAEVVKNTLEVIYKVCANNELHFFCCPYFNKGGVFERVYVTDEDMCATDFMKFLNKFSRTGINQKIKQGFVDISFDQLNKIREDYANEAKFSVKQFTDIIGKFTEKKGVSNVADFADMRFLPYWIMNQLVEPLTSVWKQYKYFVVDESQDLNTLDLGLVITCDEDSYRRFIG